ncbi:MAG: diacylglycerol kinase family protein [Actinomycetaceae bacterium]|nr:diacylglycerol kinase family protein [Actinomycetaceae bacterium]
MSDSQQQRSPYIIYNPVKVAKLHRLRKLMTLGARQAGLGEPVWLETTPEDPGTGQAAQAVAENAAVVVAAGGDGTVRAVAAALAGTDIPMALLPFGTGNLLGRNLKVPPDDMQEAVDIAFYGVESHVDIAWLRASDLEGGYEIPPEGSLIPETHQEMLMKKGHPIPADDEFAFLVVAGQGWDAQIMSGTRSDLKDKVGWGAYVVAGAQSLRSPRLKARVALDNGKQYAVAGRSILFANCPSLMMGVVLAPNAKLNDGKLDVALLEAKYGLIGWLDLFTKIGAQGLGISKDELPGTTGNIEFKQSSSVHSQVSKAHPIQVDGDTIGRGRTLDVRVDKQALLIRHG